MSASNRKIVTWISLIVFIVVSIMFSAQNAIVVNAQTAKNVSKEKVAVDFIKSVYSDFRTIKDNDAFDKAIQEQVSEKAGSFKQLLKDRKYIHELDDVSFNTEERLISEEYKKPKLVFEDENSASLFIEAEYQYKEEYAKGSNVKAEDNEDLTSGIQVFYKVNMLKENGIWKIKDVQSNDLTAGVMFPGCIYNANEWGNSANVKKNSVKSLYKSQQKKEEYNLKEIIERRKQEGEISKKDQDKINEKGSIESKVVAVKRHGKFHKMYAKPLRNYQNKWWNKRNPKYQDCDSMGGDCTNYKGKFIKRYGTSGTTNILVKGYYD